MEDTSPRVALVTGGTGGLGAAAAVELARCGWSIFLQHADPRPDDRVLESIRAAGEARGGALATGRASLTVAEGREQLVEQVLEACGRIDMLVNSPSHGGPADDLLEVGTETLRQALAAGLEATFGLTQLVANEMVRMVQAALIEDPKIVTINSISAYTTSVDHGPQCISRAGLSMMTRLFADRLGEHGVRVYEIRVGLISTGAGDPQHARYDELIAQGLTPIQRWGRASDVGRAVAAVGADLLDFSTGEILNVDGGFHLRRL